MPTIVFSSRSAIGPSVSRSQSRRRKHSNVASNLPCSRRLQCVSILVVVTQLFTLQPVLVRAASTTTASSASTVINEPERRPIQAPAKAPNRTLPAIETAPGQEAAGFSKAPTDKEITDFGGFAESLVPIGGKTTTSDNKAIASFLQSWRNRTDPEDFTLISGFVANHPKSPWATALLINQGLECRRLGYFSLALDAWQAAWKSGKTETRPQGRALVDRAAGELAELNARLGRYEWLEPFFKEIEGRNIQGSATEKISGARQGLWLMQNKPEDAFRCGPMALDRIRANANPSLAFDPKVLSSQSTLRGMSLSDVEELARQLGMNYVMAKRDIGASMAGIVPAVIHWKVGHYAALTGENNGTFHVEDPTFGDANTVSQRAIDAESSGYFLVPARAGGALPTGWHLLTPEEGKKVWGKGNTGTNDPNRTRTTDVKVKDCESDRGMAQYNVHAMVVSLSLSDSPLAYTPPRGEPVVFTLRYSQREANQPANFNYSNTGRKWTNDWFSYVQDSSLSADTPPVVYLPGGGVEVYPEVATDNVDGVLYPRVTYWYDTGVSNPPPMYVETAEYKPQQESRAVLVKTSRNVYEKRYPDGSKEVFAHRTTDANVAYPRKILLTQRVDAAGNETNFTYGSSTHRLRAVTDAIGQVTTLHYDNVGDPLKITSVDDPFGRTAILDYNDQGQLAKITDVQGLTSEFTYTAGDFINTLKTGYGTTTFAAGGNVPNRWLEVTDPQGDKERTEYLQGAPGIPMSEPPGDTPQGIPTFNNYLAYRNTFYFSKEAYKEASLANGTFDYTKARLYHWLHTSDVNVCSGFLESTKEAYENRVWRYYQGQTTAGFVNQAMLSLPSTVARVIDDGTTQIYRYQYNDAGRVTRAIDPLGRETTFIYSPSGINLKEVRQKRGATTDLLASYTYYDNHLPYTTTDAAGQTTTFTYNGYGQIKTIKDAQNHITTAVHDDIGYLKGFVGPNPAATVNFEYDGYGRVREVRNSDNYAVDTEYDALNRPTRVTYPDGTYEETIYNLLNVEWTRDRLGRWTHTYFNSIRQVIGVEDPEYRFTGYEWCRCGDLRKIIDPLGHVTAWKHDAAGRVTSKSYADQRGDTYVYEPKSGRLSTVTDAMGQQAKYQYYGDNALKQVDYTSTQRAAVSVGYSYEPDYPRLSAMTDSQGATTYGYSPVGVAGAGRVASIDGPLDNDTITFQYDTLGRAAGQAINGVASTLHYDDLGRVDALTHALGAFGYHYDGVSSRLSSVDIPNGQQTTFGYYENSGDRSLSKITHLAPGGGIISKFDYGYSAPGRISDWTQQRGTQPATAYKLGYDKVDQLRDATLRDVGTQSVLKHYVYNYDLASNRTGEQIDNLVATETPNEINQLTQRSAGGKLKVRGALTEPASVIINGVPARVDASNQFEGSTSVTSGNNQFEVVATDGNGNRATQRYQVNVPAAATVTQEYDFNGNLTRKTEAGQTTTYEWDAADRLTAINIGARRTEIQYDGISRRSRITEKDGGNVISEKRFLWSGNELCEERDPSGAVVTKRLFREGEQRVGGSDAGIYFHTQDHLGSVKQLTDASGTVRASFDYTPWGQQSKLTGDLDCDIGFTGFYFHSPSSLNLTRTRAYDAVLGKWISQDPIAENGGINLYRYAENSPLVYVDPSGENPLLLVLAVAAIYFSLDRYANAPGPNDPVYTGTAPNVLSVIDGAAAAPGLVGGGIRCAAKTLPRNLYHYTGARNVETILNNGLQPGRSGQLFTTPTGNLSPVQAQIELALPANRGYPGALFEIDTLRLQQLGINPVTGAQRIMSTSTAGGGGVEVIFNQNIPREAIRQMPFP